MVQPKKFTADAVAMLRQLLDEVPPYEPSELNKQQAIRALSPQILALRSKGYSWVAIAEMLSRNGVPVSAVALSTYMRRTGAGSAEKKSHRRTKPVRDVRNDSLEAGPRPAVEREGTAVTNGDAKQTKVVQRAVSTQRSAVQSSDANRIPVVPPSCRDPIPKISE